MRDIVLEETIFLDFTTRAFATGIPTVLAGTPVLSVLEENNATFYDEQAENWNVTDKYDYEDSINLDTH